MKQISIAQLDALSFRIAALQGGPPPTYAEFVEAWGHMDELSKSLLETGLACPELIGATGPYWNAVKDHLERMGVPSPEPFTLADVLETLTSDEVGG